MTLKRIILNFITVTILAFGLTPILGAPAYAAAAACGNTPAAQEVLGGINQGGNNCGDDRVNNLFATIVNILSLLAGAVAVFVIIYAGLKYMLSGGESGKVSNAKDTLLYAIVGLAVAALAQVMIHFVLYHAS